MNQCLENKSIFQKFSMFWLKMDELIEKSRKCRYFVTIAIFLKISKFQFFWRCPTNPDIFPYESYYLLLKFFEIARFPEHRCYLWKNLK